jgi:hypothetical protein
MKTHTSHQDRINSLQANAENGSSGDKHSLGLFLLTPGKSYDPINALKWILEAKKDCTRNVDGALILAYNEAAEFLARKDPITAFSYRREAAMLEKKALAARKGFNMTAYSYLLDNPNDSFKLAAQHIATLFTRKHAAHINHAQHPQFINTISTIINNVNPNRWYTLCKQPNPLESLITSTKQEPLLLRALLYALPKTLKTGAAPLLNPDELNQFKQDAQKMVYKVAHGEEISPTPFANFTTINIQPKPVKLLATITEEKSTSQSLLRI